MYSIIVLALPFIYLAITKFYINSIINKGDVEAYPPTAESALLTERIKGGKVTSKAIVAAIIELCEDNYLMLHKSAEEYEVLKLRDYEGNDRYKSKLMKVMFDGTNELSGVENSIVAYPVYKLTKDGSLKAKTKELIDEINKEYIPDNRRGYIGLENKDMRIWIGMGTALIEGIVLVTAGFRSNVISALFLIPFIYIGINLLVDPVRKNRVPTLVFGTFWSIAIFDMLTGIVRTATGNIALVLAVIAIIASYLFDINKRIDIKYFREKQVLARFLKLFNANRIKENLQFSSMNPKRFYEVLPYVCALNKQDKWMDMHKEVEIEKPNWIETEDEFSSQTVKDCVEALVLSTK